MEECDICNQDHSTEKCPTFALAPDMVTSTRARVTLPYYLKLHEQADGTTDVIAAEDLPSKFNLGNFEAVRTTKAIDIPNCFKLQIFIKDDTLPVWLDTSNEDRCNWMCLVNTATIPEEQNVMALQVGMEIIYMTMRAIEQDEVMRVWYAPHYAKKIFDSKKMPSFKYLLTLLQLNKQDSLMFHGYSTSPLKFPRVSDPSKQAECDIGVYPCTHVSCGLVFPSEQMLSQHRADHDKPLLDPVTSQLDFEEEVLSTDKTNILFTDKTALEDAEADNLPNSGMEALNSLFKPRISHVVHSTTSQGPRKCKHCFKEFDSLEELAVHVTDHMVKKEKDIRSPRPKGRPRKSVLVKVEDTPTEETQRKSSRIKRKVESGTGNRDADFVYDLGRKKKRPKQIDPPDVIFLENVNDEKDTVQILEVYNTDMGQQNHLHGTGVGTNMLGGHEGLANSDNDESPYTVIEIIDADQEAERSMDMSLINIADGEVDVKPQVAATNSEATTSAYSASIQNVPAINISPDVSAAASSGTEKDSSAETKLEDSSIPMIEKALPVLQNVSSISLVGDSGHLDSSSLEDETETTSVPKVENLMEISPSTESHLQQISQIYDDKKIVPSIMNLDDLDVITGEPLSDRSQDASKAEDAKQPEEEAQETEDKEEADGKKSNEKSSDVDTDGEAILDETKNIYTCKSCGEERQYMGLTELEQHLLSHVGVVRCKTCKKMYDTSIEHVCRKTPVIPKEKSPVKAKPEPVVKVEPFERVKMDDNDTPYYKCKECGRLFEKLPNLQRHIKRHRNPLGCSVCDQVFESEEVLNEHDCTKKPLSPDTDAQEEEENFCEFCGACFSKLKYLIAHMASHTEKNKCQKCGTAFARKETLLKHWTKCMPDQVQKGILKVFPCKKCHRVFGKEVSLHNHAKVHAEEYKCKCGKVFASKFSLDRHEPSCNGDGHPSPSKKYLCGTCGKSYSKQEYLERHQLWHTGKFVCVLCNTNYSRKEDLTRHMLDCSATIQVDNFGQIKCMVCPEVFNDTHAFKLHYEEHTHPYRCDSCGKLFLRASALKNHEKDCKPFEGDPVTCDVCKKIFRHPRMLLRHKQVHNPKKYECKTCGKWFRRIDYLNDHVCLDENGSGKRIKRNYTKTEVSNKETFVCTSCGKTFSSLSNLNKHMILHGEKNEECEVCHKKFHLKVSLREHMKYVHTDERQIECKICKKRLKSRNSLYGHMQLYHSEVDTIFPCEECGKTFRSKGNLQKHQLTHSSKKLYSCVHCKQTFKFPEQVRHHELWHTTGPRFYCDLCDKGFILEFQIKKHLNSVHGGLTYICSYCQMDCHHFHSMKRHLQRRHFDIPDWQSDPNKFIRELASQTKLIATMNADGVIPKPLKESQAPITRRKKEIFRCGQCDETFNSKDEFDDHLSKVHSNWRSYRCCYCHMAFGNLQLITEHLETEHSDVDEWKSDTDKFIHNLLISKVAARSRFREGEAVKIEETINMELPSSKEELPDSLLAQTLTDTVITSADDILSVASQNLGQMDLQVLLQGTDDLKTELASLPGIIDSTEPVIIAEIQGMTNAGTPTGTSQTVIIQADGQSIGPDGVLSQELADALQSLSANGALGSDNTTMITIGDTQVNDDGTSSLPLQLAYTDDSEQPGLIVLPVEDQVS